MASVGNQRLQNALRRAATEQAADELPDRELLERFLGTHDAAAFGALLGRHGPMVLGVCRAMLREAADVEDAFQATFIVLALRAASIRRTASLASWLHGVAYRTAQKARDQHARRLKHEPNAARPELVPPDNPSWREVQQVLHDELNALSERHRAPLALCYLEGQTLDQAAIVLGLSRNTLKARLERGRAVLRARLVRRGLGPAAVLLAAAWPGAAAALPPVLLETTIRTATGAPNSAAAAHSPKE